MSEGTGTVSEVRTTAQPVPALDVAGEVGSVRWQERYADALLGVYGTPSRVLVRGEGCYVWDADGRRYLDLLGGIATTWSFFLARMIAVG